MTTYFDEQKEHVLILPIKGFPGYMITADGRVISYKGIRPIVMAQKKTLGGYRFVNIYGPNANKHHGQPKKIHRIVAETFVRGQLPGLEVDHIDRDLTNNKAENLRWVTHLENMQNRAWRPAKVKTPTYFLNYMWS